MSLEARRAAIEKHQALLQARQDIWHTMTRYATMRAALAAPIASVLVLPYHHSIRLAKTAATLDRLSGGR